MGNSQGTAQKPEISRTPTSQDMQEDKVKKNPSGTAIVDSRGLQPSRFNTSCKEEHQVIFT